MLIFSCDLHAYNPDFLFQMMPGIQPPQYGQGYGTMPQRHPNPMGMGRSPAPGPGPMKNNMMGMYQRRSASAPYPPQMMNKMQGMPGQGMPGQGMPGQGMAGNRPMAQYPPNGAQVGVWSGINW